MLAWVVGEVYFEKGSALVDVFLVRLAVEAVDVRHVGIII